MQPVEKKKRVERGDGAPGAKMNGVLVQIKHTHIVKKRYF